jgi:hypothetical protein
MLTAVYLVAPNDSNGNPRRGWSIYSATSILDFVEEGYAGRAALRKAYPSHYSRNPYFGNCGEIRISASEYKRLAKDQRHSATRQSIDHSE